MRRYSIAAVMQAVLVIPFVILIGCGLSLDRLGRGASGISGTSRSIANGELPSTATAVTTVTTSSTCSTPTAVATPLARTTPTMWQGALAGLTFKIFPYALGKWPNARGPYATSPGSFDGLRDANGVRVVLVNGRIYQHPVAQAEDGLGALAAGNLALTEKEATRLIKTHTANIATGGPLGARWYPYPFDFPEYGEVSDTARAPWYSGMAQGQALDLFTRLYAATGRTKWRHAAENTFASFLFPLHPGESPLKRPWVWRVDASGYLWIEEYPTPRADNNTINGFGFALFGLIDYARIIGHPEGDERATVLAQAGLVTYLHATARARHPGGISSYSLSHLWDRLSHYHIIVTQQLWLFAAVTGYATFAVRARAFYSDYH